MILAGRIIRRGAMAALLVAEIAHGPLGCSSPPRATAAKVGFETAAHAPYPEIPTGGGPTLASVEVVSVSFQGDSHTADLVAFVDWIAQSAWLSQVVGEYGIVGIQQHVHVDLPSTAPSAVTDDDVQALLGAKVADGTLPTAQAQDPPFVYLVFFPDGTSVTRLGGDACSANPGNGYHDSLGGPAPNAPYIVVPACFPRFSALLSELAGMELETARLLVDALTDPSPRNQPAYGLTDNSNPWTSLGAELGDFCWGRLAQEGSYTLQRVWSNEAAANAGEPCIPAAPGSVPFGMTASPQEIQTVQVAVPFAFTVTGWSQAPVADWSFQAHSWVGEYAIETVLDRDTLNNGQTATLTVTIPYSVPPGTYGAVRITALSGGNPSWPVAFVVR